MSNALSTALTTLYIALIAAVMILIVPANAATGSLFAYVGALGISILTAVTIGAAILTVNGYNIDHS